MCRVPAGGGADRDKPSFHPRKPQPERICRAHHRRWDYSCLCICKHACLLSNACLALNVSLLNAFFYDSLILPTQSIFGKGLTTILSEYVAAKTKGCLLYLIKKNHSVIHASCLQCGNALFVLFSIESCPEVPAVMTSLWKKLDFTLNQIK